MEKRGPWGIKHAHSPYETPWMKVLHHDVVRPDGQDGIYGYVDIQNIAIGVLPLDADGNTFLVGQHRFPFDTWSWELPEGGGAKSDPPVEAAKRELKEETGYTANHWTEFLHMALSNSLTNERAVCFIATGLEAGTPDPDPTEVLEVERRPFREVLEMCETGEIDDAMTLAMVFKARHLALEEKLPPEVSALLRC